MRTEEKNIQKQIIEIQKALTFQKYPVTDVTNGNLSKLLIIKEIDDNM